MAEDAQGDDEWGPDDADVEQWLEEWAEVDRTAAEYLDEAMRGISREPLPGPDLDRMATALRTGAASGAADYRYFATALGGLDAFPPSDRDLWVQAVASSLSPPDDPGDDVESLAVLFALEHVDWLGLVLGLVRRGVGAIPDADDVVADIDALDDIDGEVEDPDGLASVLTEAIEILAPRWETLGVLDDERRLTRLGRWGLPVALGEVWHGLPQAPAVDEELRAAAMELLVERPHSLDELRTALAKVHRIVDEDELYRAITADDSWGLIDGTYGHLPTLVEGLVLTHRLSAEEVALDALDDDADLALFGFLADEGVPLHGGGDVVVRRAEHGYEVPGPGRSSLQGPQGWLGGFAPGDVIALRYATGEVVLEPAVFPTDPDADDEYTEDLVTIVRTARALAEEEALQDDAYGVWFADLVGALRADHPRILRRAHPPLGTLLREIGFEVKGSFFGLPGTPWRGEPDWFDDRQREAWGSWLDAVGAVDQERLPGTDELATLAAGLAGSDLVAYVLADLDDTPQHAGFVAAMREAVSGRLSAVPLLMEARLTELRGLGLQTLSLVELAVEADPRNLDALAELGDLRSIAGDAVEAERLYLRAELDTLADDVVLVRRYLAPPADGPPRNKPCPCGSGKKYKVCHGRTATHALSARAPWLWRKIMMFVQRGPNRAELLSWAGLLAGTDPEAPEAVLGAMEDPTTHDFATYDGGLLARFIATWGPLLPPDELELAQQWQSSSRRLMEVLEVRPFLGLRVRDLVSGETLEILDDTRGRSTEVRDVVLGRPLADGAGALRMQGAALPVAPGMREGLLDLMRDAAPGEVVAAFLAQAEIPGRDAHTRVARDLGPG